MEYVLEYVMYSIFQFFKLCTAGQKLISCVTQIMTYAFDKNTIGIYKNDQNCPHRRGLQPPCQVCPEPQRLLSAVFAATAAST